VRTREERATTYRLRAEEIRTAAENMRHPESRATFLRISRDYELMADNLEGQIKREALRKAL
jgi:hypothetical protein